MMNTENDEPIKNNKSWYNSNKLLYIIIGISIIIVIVMNILPLGQENMSYTDFISAIENDHIASVKIFDNKYIRGQYKQKEIDGDSDNFVTRIPYNDNLLLEKLIEHNITVTGGTQPPNIWEILRIIFPWFFVCLIIFTFINVSQQMRNGGNKAFLFSKNIARKYDPNENTITFIDVAGQNEAKEDLIEIVEFLRNSEKFTDIGARIPKGVLLTGPPGTGKTLLARAVAGEAGVHFSHMSGSDFMELFVGIGASRVRDLFAEGRKNSPCIIFIDELDAVGRSRGYGHGGGNDEREQTLNQILVEMDGFSNSSGVIVLAATNRVDVLDAALLRPGRFDRQIIINLPDVSEREEILSLHMQKIKIAEDVTISQIARSTPRASGADLANIVNEAALLAARKDKTVVDMVDFHEAMDKVVMGAERRSTFTVMDEETKRETAYHEAGHALLHYLLPNADSLRKVTIMPRGQSLGMAVSLPEKEQYSFKKDWITDRIVIAYGGIVAEKIVFDETTSGVSNDLQQATELARRMVCEWGMSSLGPVSFMQNDFYGKDGIPRPEYSQKMAAEIDKEIRNILNDCFQLTEKLLQQHREKLDVLANALIESETLEDEEVRELLGFSKTEV